MAFADSGDVSMRLCYIGVIFEGLIIRSWKFENSKTIKHPALRISPSGFPLDGRKTCFGGDNRIVQAHAGISCFISPPQSKYTHTQPEQQGKIATAVKSALKKNNHSKNISSIHNLITSI